MRTAIAVLAVVFAAPVMADTMQSYAVTTSATQVFTPSSSNAFTKSLKVINRSAATIYCSPSSSVTTGTGDPISAGGSAPYPAVPVWCISGSSQAGTGTDRTLVWESDA